MHFHETPIAGAWLIELKPFTDDRGYFARSWCEEIFAQQGLTAKSPQTNIIFSHKRGTLRGVHFQLPPHQEVKLVRCLRGELFDVCVDLRTDSPTYLQWHAVHLKEGDMKMFYVPEGCGHGCQTLLDSTELQYQASVPFAPDHARGIRYDDPAIGIQWPLEPEALSAADSTWPPYDAESLAMTCEASTS